jgi:hypothetical protein
LWCKTQASCESSGISNTHHVTIFPSNKAAPLFDLVQETKKKQVPYDMKTAMSSLGLVIGISFWSWWYWYFQCKFWDFISGSHHKHHDYSIILIILSSKLFPSAKWQQNSDKKSTHC